MRFIILENDIIQADYDGDPSTVKLEKGQTHMEVPANFNGRIGQNINSFDSSFKVRPLSELVEEKYVEIPSGFKIENEEFVEKTQIEKYADGDIDIPTGFKIVEDNLIEKTIQEKLSDNEITEEQILDRYIRPQRNRLLDECDLKYCNALELRKMSESKITKWKTYKQELKDFPAKVDFQTLDIKNIQWPTTTELKVEM